MGSADERPFQRRIPRQLVEKHLEAAKRNLPAPHVEDVDTHPEKVELDLFVVVGEEREQA